MVLNGGKGAWILRQQDCDEIYGRRKVCPRRKSRSDIHSKGEAKAPMRRSKGIVPANGAAIRVTRLGSSEEMIELGPR
jgi:hypothetical protein